MKKKTRRKHSKEFKQQAVAAMADPDVSNEQLARNLGVDISLLYKWRKELEDKGDHAFPGQGQHSPGSPDDELARLRRENAQLRQERDFLRSAAAYFAKELPQK